MISYWHPAMNWQLGKDTVTLLLGWFLPVTPRDVRMPLFDEAVGPSAGIISISDTLRDLDLPPARSESDASD